MEKNGGITNEGKKEACAGKGTLLTRIRARKKKGLFSYVLEDPAPGPSKERNPCTKRVGAWKCP